MKLSPPITVQINTGSCAIQIRGRRSTLGWDVLRVDGAHSDHQGHRKTKDEALKLAHDCCEPGVVATFQLKPTSK